jgi:hypothetical protein
MGIVRSIRVLVVHPVDCNPIHRRALRAAHTQDGQAMFQPGRATERAVRQEAMITDVDAERPEQVKADDGPR